MNTVMIAALACGLCVGALAVGQRDANADYDRSGRLLLAQAATHTHAAGAAPMHDHGDARMMPADVAPSLSFTMTADTAGGWHIDLEPANFTFAPEHVDGAPIDGEGHAHLYVDGEKVTRVYAADHYLAPLAPGVHDVMIVLYGNDHVAYGTDDGRLSAARYVIQVREQAQAFRSVNRIHDLSIREGRLENAEPTLRVSQGETVALGWSVDVPAELHLHGYDVEAHVAPDMTTTMYFQAHAAGRFPVNLHSADGESDILYLEVYPD